MRTIFTIIGSIFYQILVSQNVGIGIPNPLAKLHINGNQKIEGLNTLEFGSGLSKESNAGKIGYKTFSTIGLDIVGAGTIGTNRRIFFFGEGGSTFNGNVVLNNSGKLLLGTDTPLFNYGGSLLQIYSPTFETNFMMKGANGGSNYNSISILSDDGSGWNINHKSQAWANNDHHLAFDYYDNNTTSYVQYAFKLTSTGKAGFGYDWNEAPPENAKVSVKGGDVYIDDISKGVIMKSPNGNCWRLTINNSGAIVTTSVVCP